MVQMTAWEREQEKRKRDQLKNLLGKLKKPFDMTRKVEPVIEAPETPLGSPSGEVGSEEFEFNKKRLEEQKKTQLIKQEEANKIKEEEAPEAPKKTITPEQQIQFNQDNPNETIDEFGNVTPKIAGRATSQDRAEIEAMQAGGELYADRQAAKAEAQQLSGQVGQYDPLAIDQDSSLDYKEAAITGLVDFIPRAITGIGSLALLRGTGLVGGAGGAATAGRLLMGVNPWVAGAAIIAGITASMISNFKSQRRDTTTAQQRVLDEGKQSLQDWSTQAAADPANKMMYLAEFNKQLAQIDQADRQMKWDTAHDILKFETAIPNKAEFIAFYSVGGERDALIADMRLSIGGGQDPQVIQYKMLELAERYDES